LSALLSWCLCSLCSVSRRWMNSKKSWRRWTRQGAAGACSKRAAESARKSANICSYEHWRASRQAWRAFLSTPVIGLDLAVAWGVISFVLNYIPYIGPLVAVILPVIFATAQFESWQMAAVIFGSLYLIQLIIGNYLEPILTGNALAISPFVM